MCTCTTPMSPCVCVYFAFFHCEHVPWQCHVRTLVYSCTKHVLLYMHIIADVKGRCVLCLLTCNVCVGCAYSIHTIVVHVEMLTHVKVCIFVSDDRHAFFSHIMWIAMCTLPTSGIACVRCVFDVCHGSTSCVCIKYCTDFAPQVSIVAHICSDRQ